MSATKQTITVNVTIGSPLLSKAGFGTIMIITPAEDTVFTDRVKTYGSLAEVEVDFASTTVTYKAAQAAFQQSIAPPTIKIGRLEAADASYTAALGAIAEEDNDWYFLAATTRTLADQQLCAAYAQSNTKLAVFAEDDKAMPLLVALEALSYDRSLVVYHSTADGTTSDLYAEIAFAARNSITTPGSSVWAEKDVIGVTADTFTTSEITAIEAINGNYFIDVRGETLPYEGKVVSGEWADVIRFADWLAEEIAFNTLSLKVAKSQANSKVPFSSSGITMFENEIRAAFKTGETNGGLAPQGENPAYEIIMPIITDVSSAGKQARLLKNVSCIGRLAGAILYAIIDVNLEV